MSGIPQSLELNPDVVCSPLAEGGVLFDLATKQDHALNPTGMLIWQVLEDGAALDPVVASLARRYPGTRSDAFGVSEFGRQLVALGLAQDASDGSGSVGAPEMPAAPMAFPPTWAPPEVTPHGRPLSKVILSPFDPTVPVPE